MSREVESSQGFYDPVAKYVEQFCHGRCATKFPKGCHDPVAAHVERPYCRNGGLIMHIKG